jgi:pimeloyl-ACP methyl ester carboxylesterase
MLDKCIKLGGSAAGPRGRDANRYASNGTQRIAYQLQGVRHRRRPWLILIHGMGFDRSGWDPVLPALRRRFRLVLMDNRGTGRSGQPDGSFAVADMAGDVVAVLDAAGIGRAHVLGASLGGLVAQELAITRPQRVGRLVLACTTPGWALGYPLPAASVRLIMATRGRSSPSRSLERRRRCFPAGEPERAAAAARGGLRKLRRSRTEAHLKLRGILPGACYRGGDTGLTSRGSTPRVLLLFLYTTDRSYIGT